MTETFPLDTSGRVEAVPGSAHHAPAYAWSDLSPFVQGYVEAMFDGAPGLDFEFAARCIENPERHFRYVGFSDLAPATLAAILRDCEAMMLQRGGQSMKSMGEAFWADRQQGRLVVRDFQPVSPFLSDDGKIYLREVGE